MLLIEETLKMIIAVIALSFLVYFLVSLYYTSIEGDEIIQAQADINKLGSSIKNGSAEIILNNPVGWSLFGFVNDLIPNACAGEKCLCICDEVFIGSFVFFDTERQFDECNEDGACIAVKELESFSPIEIEQVTKILINKEDGKVVISK